MNEAHIKELREKVKIGFADVAKPVVGDGELIGCCKDHEDSFTWYKEHSVDEFSRLMQVSNTSYGLDPVEFGSLRSDLFVYFTQGYLIAVLDGLVEHGAAVVNTSWLYDWTLNYWPRGADSKRHFLMDKIPAFTDKQRQLVCETLILLNDVAIEKEEAVNGLACGIESPDYRSDTWYKISDVEAIWK